MKFFSTIAIMLSTAFLSTSAMAQVTARASIGDTSYQLIDLDASDGVAPEISFFNISNTVQSRITTGNYSDNYTATASRTASTTRSANVAVGDMNSGAAASYSGGNFGSASSSGQVNEVGSFGASQSFTANFTLSPKTLLLFFGHLSGSAAAGSYYDQSTYSSASASLSGSLLPGGIGYQNSQISANAASYYYNNSYDTSFTLSFVNGGSSDLGGSWNLATSTSGNNYSGFAQPVPEPETYAMMLAGLTLLGAVVRRRQQQKLG